MTQDNVPITLVASGWHLSDHRKFYVHYERADLGADQVETVDLADPSAPLTAQECRSDRVLARWAREGAEHHDLRPRTDEVDVVRAGIERRYLSPRRSSSDLGDRNRAVGPPEPFHVTQPRVHAEDLERPRAGFSY